MWNYIRGLYLTIMQLMSLHTLSAERGRDRPEIISNRLEWKKSLPFPRTCAFLEEHKYLWLIFLPYSCDLPSENIKVSGAELSWKRLDDIHDVNRRSQAYLRAAPKLNAHVLIQPTAIMTSQLSWLFLVKIPSQLWRKKLFSSKHGAAECFHIFHVW